MGSLFLLFPSLLLRTLVGKWAFCFFRNLQTGTACLSSAAIILSVQGSNMQNFLRNKESPYSRIFTIEQKKSLAKNRMTKSQIVQIVRELGGAQFWGPISDNFFKRFYLFSLTWHQLFCMYVHSQQCLNTQMLHYG